MRAPARTRQVAKSRTLKQRAVALLARREYARAELSKRLAATGAALADIEVVLDELSAMGLLSDARFAAALVHQKTGDFSRRAIAHALRGKGVDAAESTAALAALDGEDEFAAAHALWERRFGTPPSDDREKARQVRFLLSRGYSHSIAFKVLRAAGTQVSDDA